MTSSVCSEGRIDNMNDFKPGVETILLLFSDQRASTVYELPWYKMSLQWVEPILRQVRCRKYPRATSGF